MQRYKTRLDDREKLETFYHIQTYTISMILVTLTTNECNHFNGQVQLIVHLNREGFCTGWMPFLVPSQQCHYIEVSNGNISNVLHGVVLRLHYTHGWKVMAAYRRVDDL